jgi:hypothetical protein
MSLSAYDITAVDFDLDKAQVVWKATMGEIQLQMTRATFNSWLSNARLKSYDDGVFVVEVLNDYAKDWLENRLVEVLERTLNSICGGGATVEFVAREFVSRSTIPLVRPSDSGEDEVEAASTFFFPGFEPYQSNFVQTPKQYYEIVLPEGPPVLAAFVGQVIAKTIGVIVNFHTNERREWWEASYKEIGRACGIKSKASVGLAVRESRKRGYVVREAGELDFKYRLRRHGEPVDS